MEKVETLDARGLSCPQPALLAKQALGRMGGGQLQVLLDSAASRDNVSRIARNAGWNVREESVPDGFRLVLTK